MIPHNSDWETLKVDAAAMRTFVARPTDPAAADGAPGVLVIQHAGGVDQFVQGWRGAWRRPGSWPPPRSCTTARTRPRMNRWSAWDCCVTRRSLPIAMPCSIFSAPRRAPPAGPAGVVGFCMGGRAAYLLAAASARLQAAVAFYGGNTRVAWGEGEPPFERLGEIRCPVLGFFGGRDSNPSPEDRDAIDAELTRHGVEHRFHSFAGAGHGYMDFTNATRYHTESAADSWPLTLEFLRRHLTARC